MFSEEICAVPSRGSKCEVLGRKEWRKNKTMPLYESMGHLRLKYFMQFELLYWREGCTKTRKDM